MSGRIEELQVFMKVVECGNFSSAGDLLNLTPSGVSKLVQRLENRLGVQLFYRNSRRLTITHEGQLLYERACRIVAELDQAERSIGAHDEQTGLVRVNTMLTFAKYQIAPLLTEFHRRHPGIEIDFVLGALPIDMLKQGVDIAIHSGVQADSGLVAKPLGASRWVLCASPDYLARHGTPQTPADLAEHNCLHFSLDTAWNRWVFNDPRHPALQARGWAGADQGDMLMEMAIQGLGIARLAEFHIHGALHDGRLVQLLSAYTDHDTEPLYMIYPSRRLLSPRVARFKEFLEAYFADGLGFSRAPHQPV